MDKETKVMLVKMVVQTVAGVATAVVVGMAFEKIAPNDNLTGLGKAGYRFGVGLVGAIASGIVVDYVGTVVDKIANRQSPDPQLIRE